MKHVNATTRPGVASVWTGEPNRVCLEYRDGEWGIFVSQTWGGPTFYSFVQIVEGIKHEIL
mgnify:CR=1 FL=1